MLELKIAQLSDIEDTLKLHYRYQVDSINEEDKKDGFVTTPFTYDQLKALIEQEQGLFIAKKDGEEVEYWSKYLTLQESIWQNAILSW